MATNSSEHSPAAASEPYTKDLQAVLAAERARIGVEPRYGLSLSGGGIRSASFALGVMQALVSCDVLKRIDYMSTVSGGGYLGSALTWWLYKGLPHGAPAGTEPHNFPFGIRPEGPKSAAQGTNSADQNAILDFLRFHGNYLLPGFGLNTMSLVAVVLRVAIVSLTVYFSWLSIIFITLFVILHSIDLFRILNTIPVVDNFFRNLPLIGRVCYSFDSNGATTFGVDFDCMVAKLFLFATAILFCLFFGGSLLYSVFTLVYQIFQLAFTNSKWSSRRYTQRTNIQKKFGLVLTLVTCTIALGLLPIIDLLFDNYIRGLYLVGLSIMIGIVLAFWRGTTEPAENLVSGTGLRQLLGTALLLYSLVMGSFLYSKYVIGSGLVSTLIHLFVLSSVAILLGFLVSVNYLGIHRMYRDRLMELFLPSKESVSNNTWGLAKDADGATVESMCKERPYHLINTNVVLVDSRTNKYRGRGGDNFIISALYCGSEATGWCRSDHYMKQYDPGMTLATAMAISGAAANPNTGVAGAGFTRNRVVSTLMSLLNLRLGHWAPHPDPAKSWRLPPNFIFPGITSGVLIGRLNEDSRVVDLTDGGHFDNLGLYELIRRKLEVIIVCDGSADAKKHFTDLGIAIERVKVDFRANIRFDDEDLDLSWLRPGSVDGDLAKRGFAVASITYDDGKKGTLLYIKASLIPGLPSDIYGYHSLHSAFPDEATVNQFFHEGQFEAYRELGYRLGRQLLKANVEPGEHPQGKWIR